MDTITFRTSLFLLTEHIGESLSGGLSGQGDNLIAAMASRDIDEKLTALDGHDTKCTYPHLQKVFLIDFRSRIFLIRIKECFPQLP